MVDQETSRLRPVLYGLNVLNLAVFVVGAVFAPALLAWNPLGLIGVAPFSRHLLLAAPLTDVWSFVLVAGGRWYLSSVILFYLGRQEGPRAMHWMDQRMGRLSRLIRWLQYWFRRAPDLVCIIYPSIPTALIAGVAGMPAGRFLLVTLVGCILRTGTAWWAGDLMGEFIVPVLGMITRYFLELTAVFLGIWLVSRLVRRWRAGKAKD